jgi:hypothetical protein
MVQVGDEIVSGRCHRNLKNVSYHTLRQELSLHTFKRKEQLY